MKRIRPRPAALAALVAACWAPAVAGQDLRTETRFASAESLFDPVRWIFAQVGAGAGAPGRGPDAEVPRAGLGSRLFPFLESGEPVGFAPARWGGTFALEHLDQQVGSATRRTSDNATLSLSAASYFWQPWYAQVRGNLTLLMGRDRGGEDPLSSGGGSAALNALSVSGGGTLTVFPGSRFPFLATFDSSDSRASGEFSPSDYRNTRASLRQTWRDPLGESTVAGGFDYSRLDSASFGRDTVVALDARYQLLAEKHRADAAFNWSRNRRSADGGGADNVRLFGTHLYTPMPDLWVNSLASLTQSDFSVGDGSLVQRIVQAHSQGVWRPAFDDRLVFTGGGRLFASDTRRAGEGGLTSAVSANAGAAFAPTESLTLNATGSVTDLDAGESGRSTLGVATLGATWSPAPRDLGFALWSPALNVQAGQESGGEQPRRQGSAQADQQVSRSFSLGRAVSVNLVAGQGASVVDDSVIGRTTVLRYNASAGLRVAATDDADAYFGGGWGQSDATGALAERFRLSNAQASGQVRFGPHDLLTANLTAQWIRSLRDGDEAQSSSRQVVGSVAYQHSRVFGVPRLRFQASATFNQGFLDSRLLGDVDATRENVTRLIDTRLLYDVGRLEFRLGMRIAKTDGRDDRQWTLRVARQFGQF